MKKLNLICASIASLIAVSAHAGTATATAKSIAIENFGTTSTAAATTAAGAITYSMSNITAVNGGSPVYFTVRLTGGKFASTAGPALSTLSFGGVNCTVTASVTCVVTASTDQSTIKVQVTPASTTTLGLGAFSYSPGTSDINGVNTTLNTVGGKVSASIGLTTLNPSSIEASTTQSNVDGALGTADIAVAARAITPAVSATTSTVKIDLTTSPAGSVYTAGANGLAPLGQFKFTEVAGVRKADDSGDYVLTGNTAVTAVVTPGAGQSFPIGSVLKFYTDATCGTASAGTNNGVTVTSGNASSALTLTLTNTPSVTTGTNVAICMTAPSSSPTQNLATPIQPTLAATVTPAVATHTIATASGTGYNLAYNGSTVTVNTYWPGGLTAYNFTGYLRVTNTGSVSAAVSAAHLSPLNGSAGTSGVIIGSLAAGQTVLLQTKDVDAILGAAPSGVNAGRIRVTAPTDGLRVQSMLQFNGGNLVEFANN